MIPVHLIGKSGIRAMRGRSAGAVSATAVQTIPPELTGTIPRNVELTGGGLALVIFAVAMTIAGFAGAIALTLANQRAVDQAALRARDGVAAQAEVVGIWTQRGEQRRRIVTYQYEAGGRTLTGETRLHERDQRAMARGDRIAIGYLRSAPATSWIASAEPSIDPPLWLVPLVSLSALFGAAAALFGVRRQWLLLADGRPALARVTSSRKISGQHGPHYRVEYEFQALSGATVKARYDAGRTAAAIGSLVPIVYHRETPLWSAIYPLQLVRPQRG